MKTVASFLFSLSLMFTSFGQSKHSLGMEILGNAGLYSVVYNGTIVSKGHYELDIRPQLSAIPGEPSSETPSHLVTICGLSNNFGNERIYLNFNVTAGIDFGLGKGREFPQFLSSLMIGPKLKTDFAIIGISYVYFLREPRFFYMKMFPHSFGISFEFEL